MKVELFKAARRVDNVIVEGNEVTSYYSTPEALYLGLNGETLEFLPQRIDIDAKGLAKVADHEGKVFEIGFFMNRPVMPIDLL